MACRKAQVVTERNDGQGSICRPGEIRASPVPRTAAANAQLSKGFSFRFTPDDINCSSNPDWSRYSCGRFNNLNSFNMNEINPKHIWAVRRHPIHKNLCISGQPEQSNTSVSANTNSRFATQNFSYILHAAFCDTLLPDNEFPRDEIATFFDISLTTIHNHFLSKGGDF